jgi:hypothetical protein
VRKALLSFAVGVAGLLIVAPAANATFHDIRIRAVFLGPPDVSFIELQMFDPGQTLVSGQNVSLYNAAGAPTVSFPLNHDVGNGANQSTILLADIAQATTPDFSVGALYEDLLPIAGGGAACYSGFDCVSWGNFTGQANLPSPDSSPAGGNLTSSMVVARSISRGCPTALDTADDTNSSSADFGFAVGFPVRANATAPTEVLCPPPVIPATVVKKKKCKKKKKKHSAAVAKKKCKKKKKH